MYIVILSGGLGTRLWPKSRKLHPKPFIKLSDGNSILKHTLYRALQLDNKGIINITSIDLLFKVQAEIDPILSLYNTETIYIAEPFGKGTAAAIAVSATLVAQKFSPEELILVLPSDHIISDITAFRNAITKAQALAHDNQLVTFGIHPTHPEPGYGYIRLINSVHSKRFIEKPLFSKALEYYQSGNYLWNSGMFCFKASTILSEMKNICPDILSSAENALLSASTSSSNSHTHIKLDPNIFSLIREESIDYALMEKADKIAVIPCDLGWSDVGTWNTFSKIHDTDDNSNVIKAQTVLNKVTNCYIESTDRIIGAIGLDNLVIVDTPDALLVANKNNIQEVKDIYTQLMKTGHPSHESHTTVYRPWGSYTILEESINFKIKRIEVLPWASLSLQSHKHRSEHWVVMAGQATVLNNSQELVLAVNESVFIPAHNKHRLSNYTNELLVLIEIQTGSYLGEDDIIRHEDIYDRCNTLYTA